MPYSWHWEDEPLRILHCEVSDPLEADDQKRLQEELLALASENKALFVLLDLSRFNVMQAFQKMMTSLDGEPLPDLAFHTRHSRLAVIGGGPLLQLAVMVAGENDSLRNFTAVDQALAWLKSEAAH